jgi:hypothetical protein
MLQRFFEIVFFIEEKYRDSSLEKLFIVAEIEINLI